MIQLIDTVYYARGQVYWREYNSNVTPGVIAKKRPVLIVSNNVGNAASGVAIVAPLTSAARKSDLPTQVEINLNGTKSWVLTEQLLCVSQKTLSSYIATVTDYKMKEVDEAIKVSLGLSPVLGYNSSDVESLVSDSNVSKDASKSYSANDISTNNESNQECKPLSEVKNHSKQYTDMQHCNLKETQSRKRRKNYTNDEKLAFCVDYEDAKVNKCNRENFLKKYEINSFGVATNYYKRFKNSLGV